MLIGGTSRPRRYDAAGGDLCDLGRIYSECGSQVAEDGISNFSASPTGLVISDPATGVDLAEVMRDGRPQLLSGSTGDSPQINDARQITDFVSSEQGVTRGPWSRDRLLLWASAASPTAPSTRPGPTTLATNGWNPDGSQILLPDGWSQRAGTPAAARWWW